MNKRKYKSEIEAKEMQIARCFAYNMMPEHKLKARERRRQRYHNRTSKEVAEDKQRHSKWMHDHRDERQARLQEKYRTNPEYRAKRLAKNLTPEHRARTADYMRKIYKDPVLYEQWKQKYYYPKQKIKKEVSCNVNVN